MSNKNLDIKNNVTPTSTTSQADRHTRKEEAKRLLEKFMKEELQTVRGVFQNFETPGASLRLQVKKYPGHFFDLVLEDGKEYEVPLYIARHLNGIDATASAVGGRIGTCSYEVHKYIVDKDGLPIISRETRKKRYGFQSIEFASAATLAPVA